MYKCVADNVLNTRCSGVRHFLDSQLRVSGVDISTFLPRDNILRCDIAFIFLISGVYAASVVGFVKINE